MDFIRKPEVLATANAVGTASIYFILSKRLNALTDEMDEIDNHLTSSIKKVSENSRSIQGIAQTFQDVLLKFEEHKKTVSGIGKMWKKIDEEIQEMNERYDMLISAVKDLGGNVDTRRLKKKKKKSKSYEEDRRRRSSDSSDTLSSESEPERERRDKKDKKPQKKDSKTEYNSDEDFVKKAQEAKKNLS
jgi:chromosome segregation ATPase